MGETFKDPYQFDAYEPECIAAAKAIWEAEEDSILQSVSLSRSNQTKALMWGKLFTSWVVNASVIQVTLFPPTSVEAVSAIIIGL